MSTTPVFLVDALPTGPSAVLDGPEGRHAATVRRLRPGEELLLSDGAGGLARCAVVGVGRDVVDLSVLSRQVEPAPALRVVVVQALIKGDRGELALELATEAGVDAVVPWRAARSVVRWEDGPRGAKALARWRSTVREAAKQARRSRVPSVSSPVTTVQLAEMVKQSTTALLLDASGTPFADISLPPRGDLMVIVGPEGGIADEEVSLLVGAGAQVARLGPTVLRASTAAVVALAAIGARTERWR